MADEPPGIRETLRLVEKNADERHEATLGAIRGLGRRVEAVETKVESLATADTVRRALDARAAEVKRELGERQESIDSKIAEASLSHKDRVVAVAGVAAAVSLGVLNLIGHFGGL